MDVVERRKHKWNQQYIVQNLNPNRQIFKPHRPLLWANNQGHTHSADPAPQTHPPTCPPPQATRLKSPCRGPHARFSRLSNPPRRPEKTGTHTNYFASSQGRPKDLGPKEELVCVPVFFRSSPMRKRLWPGAGGLRAERRRWRVVPPACFWVSAARLGTQTGIGVCPC
jgi:hypothetical protein